MKEIDKQQRSIRRHHRERLLRKRANYWGRWITQKDPNPRVINTPSPCSCWMCANPRKLQGNSWEALTIQELRVTQRQLSENFTPNQRE